MSDWRENVELMVQQSKIKVPYTWSVGETGSRFLRALRDEKKLVGNKCPKTGQVFCPPKLNSPYTLEPITEWVELPGTGTVQTFTRRHYSSRAAADGNPNIYALIKLDGATQLLPHFLGEVDFAQVKHGMRVAAVFRDERVGHILDIKYFKPAEG
ncbi:MAG TPA: Zn-ribbon domain-containing OB-fold protein [Turneriella sp.]|nr:Zn-ribbon domain-containing OB-fold protein [Turneriella sp.]HNE19053.1 Zn-ribbon domain-containing OB-fold protein [Turneriella sp.]HNL55330.1 Zn-ribbon domain-containing OB-fold protein [Turneriella sp.]